MERESLFKIVRGIARICRPRRGERGWLHGFDSVNPPRSHQQNTANVAIVATI
jgi:hypothetical protein